ncbi:MAG: diguanylate cyclase [Burkholderiales bacterium]
MPDQPDSVDAAALNAGLLDLLQTSGALVCLKDAASGRYLWANDRYLAFVERGLEQLTGATDLDVLPLADATAVQAADQRAVGAGMPAAGEHRFERATAKLDFRTLRCVVPGPDVAVPWVLNLWWDDTASRLQAHQLQSVLGQLERQQASFDELARQHREGLDRPTELFRGEQFENHLQRELALSTREHREFALVLLAIDAPDALRAAHGDAGLAQVANAVGHLLRANTRAMDIISNVSPARFAILLSGVGLATAHTRMEQMRRQCATHVVVHGGQPMQFTVTVGLASFPHTADSLDTLSQAAEQALADAAKRGGNRVAPAAIALAARAPGSAPD